MLISEFCGFESQVLHLLVAPKLGAEATDAIEREAKLVSYDYSGAGYFLTVKHPSLPSKRIVCDKPNVVGRSGNIQSGFVVFIENGELMLECFTWGDIDVPETFRDQHVIVEAI